MKSLGMSKFEKILYSFLYISDDVFKLEKQSEKDLLYLGLDLNN